MCHLFTTLPNVHSHAHALLDQTLSHIRELFAGILYHLILPTVNLLVNLNNDY